MEYQLTEEGPNVFIYHFGAYYDPEGTEVTLNIMSGLDSSFMTFNEAQNELLMEPKEGGNYDLYIKLTDADKEFQIFTLTIKILDMEKKEEPDKKELKTVLSDDLLARLAAFKK